MDQGVRPAPQVAVGAVVVENEHLLMVKRGRAPAEGLWTVPGGRVKHGEYLSHAVEREVLEETGVAVTAGDLLGVFEVIGEPHYVILDHIADPSEAGQEPVAADDAAEARWVPFADISSLDHTPRLLEMLRGWGILPGHGPTSGQLSTSE